jgi:hypothetical protein
MGYTEVTVVVDGTLEEVAQFPDDATEQQEEFLEEQKELGETEAGAGCHTAIFVDHHPHEMEADCQCAQYATDHKPDFEYGAPE